MMKLRLSIKHNPVTAILARHYFDLRTRNLEKLIFTATTGRSGTLTLTRLFSAIPGCRAVHEPYPMMNETVLKAASYGDTVTVDRTYRWVKSITIRRAAAGYRYYLEANHAFIKTFVGQAAADFGSRLSVIHLVRNPLDVAMSIYRLQDYPGTKIGNAWWLDYQAPANRIRIASLLSSDPEYSHPFYKALWYWFEMEARIFEWKKRLPSVPFVRFETEWLSDRKRIENLFAQLNIGLGQTSVENWNLTREHGREEQKKVDPLPEREAIRMVGRFRELLFSKGYSAILPETALALPAPES